MTVVSQCLERNRCKLRRAGKYQSHRAQCRLAIARMQLRDRGAGAL